MSDSARSGTSTSPALSFAADLIDRLPFGVVVYHLEDENDPGSLRLVYANAAASDAVGFDVEASPVEFLLDRGLPAKYTQDVFGDRLTGDEHRL